jgi:hypothetical protein
MRRSLALLAALAVPCAAALPTGGCSNQASPADASTDGTYVFPGPDSGNEDAETDGGTDLVSTMRLANMSPDLGAVDFCWRVTGASSFTGPVIMGSLDAGTVGPAPQDASEGGDAVADAGGAEGGAEGGSVDAAEEPTAEGGGEDAASDAAADATPADASDGASGEGGEATGEAGVPVQVSFGAMTAFVQLPAIGTLDIALVRPDQLSCDSPTFVGHVTFDPGKSATVAIMGLLAADGGSESALVMKSFTDEPANARTAEVRFIHAALGWPGGDGPAPPLAVQVASSLLASEIDPAQVATTSTSAVVDSLGYASAPVFGSPAPIELFSLGDAATHTWTTPFFPLGLLPGTTHTAFVVSLGEGALGVAWCGGAQSGALPGSCVLERAR